jgi:hypothetical protein
MLSLNIFLLDQVSLSLLKERENVPESRGYLRRVPESFGERELEHKWGELDDCVACMRPRSWPINLWTVGSSFMTIQVTRSLACSRELAGRFPLQHFDKNEIA